MRPPKSSASLPQPSRPSSWPTGGDPTPPDVYIDVSLGGKALPNWVRSLGHLVTTKDARYGSRRVPDEEWLRECGNRREIALTKDEAIKEVFSEWSAAYYSATRVFFLANQNLRAEVQVDYFRRRWSQIVGLGCRREGPYLFTVYSDKLTEVVRKV